MDYRKIAERLVEYKIFRGYKIPFYGIQNEECGGCTSCPISQIADGNKKEWINDLETIVRMRHSIFKFKRTLSRMKK
jgi:hypothetical protein